MKIITIPAIRNERFPKRVGIYARVSTATVDQIRSLSNQVSALSQHVYMRDDLVGGFMGEDRPYGLFFMCLVPLLITNKR